MIVREPSDAWVIWAAEAEGNAGVSVGGLMVRVARREEQEKLARRAAMGKLLELRRRELGLSLEEVATKARTSSLEVANLERGLIGSTAAFVIPALAGPLGLPAEKLLHLAGLNGDADPAISEAAVRFAEQVRPTEKLAPDERAAIDSFLHVLTCGG